MSEDNNLTDTSSPTNLYCDLCKLNFSTGEVS